MGKRVAFLAGASPCVIMHELVATLSQQVRRFDVSALFYWRKGCVMRPFCHVVRKVGRWVPPRQQIEVTFDPKALITKRLGAGMTQRQLSLHLGVSPRTLWNWEAGVTSPTREFWPRVDAFIGS